MLRILHVTSRQGLDTIRCMGCYKPGIRDCYRVVERGRLSWLVLIRSRAFPQRWRLKNFFTGLETLSDWIKSEGNEGQAILFFLIFVTTFREHQSPT